MPCFDPCDDERYQYFDYDMLTRVLNDAHYEYGILREFILSSDFYKKNKNKKIKGRNLISSLELLFTEIIDMIRDYKYKISDENLPKMHYIKKNKKTRIGSRYNAKRISLGEWVGLVVFLLMSFEFLREILLNEYQSFFHVS